MRVIEYHHSNFKEVNQLFMASQQPGNKSRVLFNDTKKQFEYYEPNDRTKHSQFDTYTHIIEAIQNYTAQQAIISTIVDRPTDNAVAVDDDTVARIGDETDYNEDEDVENLEAVEDQNFFPAIHDEDVFKSTNKNLEVLMNMKNDMSRENKEKLAKIIADIFRIDVISESDIALAIVESTEYKKLLSMLFSELNVSVSSTRVSDKLEVSTRQLIFQPRIEYHLEDYRRGAAQCLVNMKVLVESQKVIDEKERRIRELTADIASERRASTEAVAKLSAMEAERAAVRELRPVFPIQYVISYMDNGKVRFLSVSSSAENNEDGSYPTKYLRSTSRMEKAKRFDSADAKAQVHRMVKNRHNVSFVDIKDKSTKEIQSLFTINRILIEKVETVNEQGI